jgi:hypothetical protein
MIEGFNDIDGSLLGCNDGVSDGILLGWSDGSLDGIDEGCSDSDGTLLG